MGESGQAQRTDGVAGKLQLFEGAYASGRLDLALSLAASLGDTLRAERQWQAPAPPVAGPRAHGAVADLPDAWRSWARGWAWYQVLEVTEEAGIDRPAELVEVWLAFDENQVRDLRRELRLARCEGAGLREVKSQVDGEVCSGGTRQGRLSFLAQVPAGGRVAYVVFYGNPWAELPAYPTDLQVRGEGYHLTIENHHYGAHLSAQTGQLERLVYRRAQGLELFAGGEGHGEPPHIDWAHDYLADGKFQKFRVTNWAACPNWEVSRGPVAVKVRRWGFPHSPVHPLFAPSRMHIDVEYTFISGQPYFRKEGSMEMVKDFAIDYLRDDEWVFSGYSFTDTVWMDREGRLHEGEVAAGQSDDLWGVGFFNRHSRDAFIALWLEHSASGFDGLHHTGVPQINYQGHGQLWSRWAAHSQPQFKAGTVLRQRNVYLVHPYEGPAMVEASRRGFLQPLQVGPGHLPAGCTASGSLGRPGETESGLKADLWAALRQVRDDMLYTADANLVDMGYIYDLRVRGDVVQVVMTMPHRGRPCYRYLGEPLRRQLLAVPGVREVLVEFTWEPAWSLARLSAAGRAAMGLEG
ncbi:MAG: metal-sulfur cluster assembly factor [Candidatus Latescibacteria bacterium]|nr:metal-sulfur cluster assembly factor [Candidatus Latescibacterota bacterium]